MTGVGVCVEEEVAGPSGFGDPARNAAGTSRHLVERSEARSIESVAESSTYDDQRLACGLQRSR